MTRTHTHVLTECANPYLVCVKCGGPATKFISFEGQAEGCDHQGLIDPCMHLESTSLCPSWSPVNGCQCEDHLGEVKHFLTGEDLIKTLQRTSDRLDGVM